MNFGGTDKIEQHWCKKSFLEQEILVQQVLLMNIPWNLQLLRHGVNINQLCLVFFNIDNILGFAWLESRDRSDMCDMIKYCQTSFEIMRICAVFHLQIVHFTFSDGIG